MTTKKPKAKPKPKPKKKLGRKPIELTEERQERFLKAIRLGCPIKDACGCAGFSDDWYYIRKKEAGKSPKSEKNKKFLVFLDKIKEVEGEATQRWLAMIEKSAMGGSWQAAAWKLERRREMFIPRVKQEVDAKVDATVEVKDAKDRLLAKLARIAERSEKEEDS